MNDPCGVPGGCTTSDDVDLSHTLGKDPTHEDSLLSSNRPRPLLAAQSRHTNCRPNSRRPERVDAQRIGPTPPRHAPTAPQLAAHGRGRAVRQQNTPHAFRRSATLTPAKRRPLGEAVGAKAPNAPIYARAHSYSGTAGSPWKGTAPSHTTERANVPPIRLPPSSRRTAPISARVGRRDGPAAKSAAHNPQPSTRGVVGPKRAALRPPSLTPKGGVRAGKGPVGPTRPLYARMDTAPSPKSTPPKTGLVRRRQTSPPDTKRAARTASAPLLPRSNSFVRGNSRTPASSRAVTTRGGASANATPTSAARDGKQRLRQTTSTLSLTQNSSSNSRNTNHSSSKNGPSQGHVHKRETRNRSHGNTMVTASNVRTQPRRATPTGPTSRNTPNRTRTASAPIHRGIKPTNPNSATKSPCAPNLSKRPATIANRTAGGTRAVPSPALSRTPTAFTRRATPLAGDPSKKNTSKETLLKGSEPQRHRTPSQRKPLLAAPAKALVRATHSTVVREAAIRQRQREQIQLEHEKLAAEVEHLPRAAWEAMRRELMRLLEVRAQRAAFAEGSRPSCSEEDILTETVCRSEGKKHANTSRIEQVNDDKNENENESESESESFIHSNNVARKLDEEHFPLATTKHVPPFSQIPVPPMQTQVFAQAAQQAPPPEEPPGECPKPRLEKHLSCSIGDGRASSGCDTITRRYYRSSNSETRRDCFRVKNFNSPYRGLTERPISCANVIAENDVLLDRRAGSELHYLHTRPRAAQVPLHTCGSSEAVPTCVDSAAEVQTCETDPLLLSGTFHLNCTQNTCRPVATATATAPVEYEEENFDSTLALVPRRVLHRRPRDGSNSTNPNGSSSRSPSIRPPSRSFCAPSLSSSMPSPQVALPSSFDVSKDNSPRAPTHDSLHEMFNEMPCDENVCPESHMDAECVHPGTYTTAPAMPHALMHDNGKENANGVLSSGKAKTRAKAPALTFCRTQSNRRLPHAGTPCTQTHRRSNSGLWHQPAHHTDNGAVVLSSEMLVALYATIHGTAEGLESVSGYYERLRSGQTSRTSSLGSRQGRRRGIPTHPTAVRSLSFTDALGGHPRHTSRTPSANGVLERRREGKKEGGMKW